MSQAFTFENCGRVRTYGAGALFVGLLLLSGCASEAAGAKDKAPVRRVPPPVSDQSMRHDGGDDVALRPRVRVSIEAEPGAQLETTGATRLVEHHGRRCYRLALQKERDLAGRVVYEVIVTSNGRVAGVEKMSSTASSQRLDACLESIFESLRFDVPAGQRRMVRRLYIRLELVREAFDPNEPPVGDDASASSTSARSTTKRAGRLRLAPAKVYDASRFIAV